MPRFRFPQRWWTRALLALVTGGVLLIVVLIASTGWFDAMGASPEGERLARIQRSPNYRDGAFRNPPAPAMPSEQSAWTSIKRWVAGHEVRTPPAPIPTVRLTRASLDRPPPSGLRATWLGHSTVLVEIDGARILMDPVWARRASPSSLVGPKRFFEPPVAIEDLPPLDAILASHDHYDHLDRGVVKAIVANPAQSRARFIVPLGVGAHLEKWGVPPNRITELDWSESTTLGSLTITATPARHFSGRGFGANHTLWASFAIAGPKHRVFHSGDTGPFPGVIDIGAKHGPFDITLMKVGAYGEGWPDIHLTPEQAVAAHQQLRGHLLIPIHWGTFLLAFHAWDEPAERVVAASLASGVVFVVPMPGQSIEAGAPGTGEPWWRAVR